MRSWKNTGQALLFLAFAIPAQATCMGPSCGGGMPLPGSNGSSFNNSFMGNNYAVRSIDDSGLGVGGGPSGGPRGGLTGGPAILPGDSVTVQNPTGGTTTTIMGLPIPVPGSTTGAMTTPVTTDVNTPTSHVITTSSGKIIRLLPDSQRWRLNQQVSGNIRTYDGIAVDGRPFHFVCDPKNCTGSN